MVSPSSRWRGAGAGPALLVASSFVTLLIFEIVLRLLAGQSITSWELGDFDLTGAGNSRDMTRFADIVSIDSETNPDWINLDPPPLKGRDEPDSELLSWRQKARDSSWAGFEINLYRQWNARWIETLDCDPESPILFQGVPLYEFDPVDESRLPVYRYLPSRTDPLGMRTNEFAWRGPEISIDKAPGTIRLAFVGASTTVGNKQCRASYPEYVIHWLNLWAQAERPDLEFDGINAAREGVNSVNIVAIVRSEILPMEPDLIFYYEGVNQIAAWLQHQELLGDALQSSADEMSATAILLDRACRYSMLATRIRVLLAGLRRSGQEPIKPAHRDPWPSDIHEEEPDPFNPDLPFGLPRILLDLDKIKRMATNAGSELAMASFVFLLDSDMTLDRWRDGQIEDFYRRVFWPLSYAEIKRLTDFQNRVFRNYARARIMGYIDLAGIYPQDSSLFQDGVHFNCDGIRLQAWIAFQKILALVRGRLAAGTWPRPNREPLESHPGISAPRLARDLCAESTTALSG